jgi:maltooligosyltrehalose trehalohydrolase
MGEEYGETAPFTYFVDHEDPELLEAVRRGRAAEHDGTANDVPDPGDPETFNRAKLDQSSRTKGVQRTIWEHYRSLLSLRAAEPALRRSSREDTTAEAFGPVVILTRAHATTRLVAFFNLSDSTQSVPLPEGGRWEELLTEGASRIEATVELAAWRCRLFRSQSIEEDAR